MIQLIHKTNHKICSECRKEQSLERFENKRDHTKLAQTCLSCREKRSNFPSQIKGRAKKKIIYEEIKALITDIKKQSQCVDCGEKNHLTLEFDHIDPSEKTNLVSKLTTIEKVKSEIAKCELRCGYCHYMKTQSTKKVKIWEGQAANKAAFVKEYKLAKKDCAECHRLIHKSNIGAFEMDHLCQENKTDKISKMVELKKYTFDDLKEELEKCRMLCRNCHWIRTKYQLYHEGEGLGVDKQSVEQHNGSVNMSV